jgi:hypothetical protein
MACSRKEAEARWLMQHGGVSWQMLLDTFDPPKRML